MVSTNSSIDWRAAYPEAGLPEFDCWSTSGEGAAWVHVAGELDQASAPRLDACLTAARLEAGTVVVDLRELTFSDCAGLHAIAAAAGRARRDGGRLMVVRPADHIDRLFSLTGLDAELELYDLDPLATW